MHYLIYDNFDQVYDFWDIPGLVYMKMSIARKVSVFRVILVHVFPHSD